ncbi:MAG: hypothetical protein QNJ03_00125 [Dinoroseobacter sp.]|nr:hypothetical protein [Dinoroseobacter sp.]
MKNSLQSPDTSLLCPDTPYAERANLALEAIRLGLDREDMRTAMVELWKRMPDEDRVAFVVRTTDFMATLFTEDERALIKAGAVLSLKEAAGGVH